MFFYYLILIYFTVILKDSTFAQNNSSTYFSPYSGFTEYLYKTNDNSLVSILNKEKITNIIFSFIQDAGKCNPAWDGLKVNSIYTNEIINLANEVKKNKISYKIAFGGQTGDDLSKKCKNSEELFNAYDEVVKIYQPSGLDYDLEGPILNNKSALKKLIFALKKIQETYPNLEITITLPVMPHGLNFHEKRLIKDLKNAKLLFTLNLLTMNYSPSYNKNMLKYSISALNNTATFLSKLYGIKKASVYRKISITPMIGMNDIRSEIFTLNDAKNLIRENKKLNLHSLHFWSLERDKICKNKINLKICSGLKKQADYEFTKIFNTVKY